MSLTPFVVGLGSGLALWQLSRTESTSETSTTPSTSLRNASRSCAITLDPGGIAVDGERTDVTEAVRRAQVVGLALVTLAPDAPASTCSELFAALRDAAVPTHSRTQVASPRNAQTRRRRNAEKSNAFTLVTYPDGVGGSRKTTRWFRTDAPMAWNAVRDQLAAAGMLDKNAISPNSPRYWKLVTDRRVFMPGRAQPIPEPEPRDATPSPRFALEGGRTISRDAVATVHLERIDLGNGRYALSPHEADLLAARIVRLLNKHGAR